MKKAKKHTFKHVDPETTHAREKNEQGKGAKNADIMATPDSVSTYIYRDLKRSVVIVAIFLAIIVGLYLIQTKTNILDPVLRLFNLN